MVALDKSGQPGGVSKSLTTRRKFSGIACCASALVCLLFIAGCVHHDSPSRQPQARPPQVQIYPKSFELSQPVVELPIKIFDNMPLIQLPRDDPSGRWYILDTGTSGLVLSTKFASEYGLRRSGSVVFNAWGRRREVPTTRIDALEIGEARFLAVDAPVIDLSGLMSGWEGEITGVIGLGFFQGLRLTIDYPAKLFRIEQSNGATAALASPDAVSIPFKRMGEGLVAIPIEIGAEQIDFMLDTGLAHGMVMGRQLAQRLGVEIDPDAQITTQTFHGKIRSGKGRLAGAAWLERLGVQGNEVLVRRNTATVGGDFLKHFCITIDTVTGRVEFRPPSAPSDRVVFREEQGDSSSPGD